MPDGTTSMANTMRALVRKEDGSVDGLPLGDFGVSLITQSPVSIRPGGPVKPIADHLGDLANEFDPASSAHASIRGLVNALAEQSLYRDGLDKGEGFVSPNGRMPLSFDQQGVASLAALLLLGTDGYRDHSGYAFAIRDLAGRIGLSLGRDGELSTDRLALGGGGYRDAHPYPFRITDTAGKTAFGLKPDGEAFLWSLLMGVAPAPYRDGYSQQNGHAFAIRDLADRIALSLDLDGELSVDRLALAGTMYRDAAEYPARIDDLAGKMGFGVRSDGEAYLWSVLMGVNPAPYRDALAQRWALTDLAGQRSIGVEADGRVDLDLSDSAFQRLRERAYISPASWRGTEVAYNLRRTANAMIATMQDADGRAYDARQRLDGDLPFALADGVGPVRAIFWVGQSNSGGGGSDSLPVLLFPLYPRHVVTFSAGYQFYGDAEVPASSLTDIAHLVDDPALLNAFPAVAFGFALEGRARKEGRATPAYFVHTNWYGGQPITTFLPGTTTYKNLMTSIAGSQSVVGKYGRPCVADVIVFVQGETGTPGYQAALASLLQSMRSDAAVQTGQPAPRIFLVQINLDQDLSAPSGVEIAQWNVAVAQAAQGVTMPCPMYQFPFGLNSTIHQGPIGRMMFGEIVALVYDRVVRQGLPFNPLWPISTTRSGKVVTIKFALPPGGGPLAFDTTWVPQAANYGFTYSDDSNSATISSVAITGPDTVDVTLSNVPTGANSKTSYAQGQTRLTGWAGGRGNLISPTGKASYFAGQGYAVPATINHYAIRFEVAVP